MKIKPHWGTTSFPLENYNKKEVTSVSEDVKEIRILVHWWWDCKMVQPLCKTDWQSLKELNIGLLYGLAIPLSIYPRELKIYVHTKIWTWMVTALFITDKNRNNPNVSSDNKQNADLYNGILFSNKKRNEVLMNAMTYTDEPWKHTKWRKTSHKSTISCFHLYEMFKISRSIETECKLVVFKGWGRRK